MLEAVSGFHFRGGSTGVLLIHGLTASPTELVTLGRDLNAYGFTTSGVVLAGHGSTPQELAQTSWRDWLTSAQHALSDLVQSSNSVFVVGLSAGSLLGLLLAAENNEVKALSLLSPALRLKSRLFFCTPWIHPFVRTITKSRTQQTFYQQHELFSYPVIPTRSLAEIRQLMHGSKEVLDEITVPTQFIIGGQDDRIDPRTAIEAFKRIPAHDKSLLHLPNASHVLSVGESAASVSSAVCAFYQRQSKALVAARDQGSP